MIKIIFFTIVGLIVLKTIMFYIFLLLIKITKKESNAIVKVISIFKDEYNCFIIPAITASKYKNNVCISIKWLHYHYDVDYYLVNNKVQSEVYDVCDYL